MSDIKFESNVGKVKKDLSTAGEKGIKEALLLVQEQAKALAKVDTGELRDKISNKISIQNEEIEGQVGSPNEYAIYNEFGTGEHAENGKGRKGGWHYRGADGKVYFTRGQKPKPFLRPAFRMNKENIKDLIGDSFRITFGSDN